MREKCWFSIKAVKLLQLQTHNHLNINFGNFGKTMFDLVDLMFSKTVGHLYWYSKPPLKNISITEKF